MRREQIYSLTLLGRTLSLHAWRGKLPYKIRFFSPLTPFQELLGKSFLGVALAKTEVFLYPHGDPCPIHPLFVKKHCYAMFFRLGDARGTRSVPLQNLRGVAKEWGGQGGETSAFEMVRPPERFPLQIPICRSVLVYENQP